MQNGGQNKTKNFCATEAVAAEEGNWILVLSLEFSDKICDSKSFCRFLLKQKKILLIKIWHAFSGKGLATDSVTRYAKILPLWQKIKKYFQIWLAVRKR